MDKATDALITNSFERRIREADRIAREFKAPQVTSGASGQLAYSIENPGQWDQVVTLPTRPMSGGGFGEYAFTITFEGDQRQKFPVASLIMNITVNGNPVIPMDRATWGYSDNPNGPPTILFTSVYYATDDPGFFDNDYNLRWVFYFQHMNDSPIAVRVKSMANASCRGVLSLQRIL